MAKQTVNIGTTANDGTGDALRVAFDKLNDNFDEVYADDFIVTARIADDAIIEAHLDATNSPVDNYILSYDSASGGFTWVQQFDGDITGIVAGNGLTGDATSGDATLAVGAGTGITVNANDVQVADNGVDHDQLGNRYTAQASISTLTGTVSFDCATATNFKLSGNLTGAYTINLSNYKKGQIITIFPLQAQSITLAAQGSSTNTFNKIGGVDYDNSTSNILQIECVDDSSTDPVFFYSIATFASDSTP